MGATVLVVDDRPTFRRCARRMLEGADFRVVGEAGGCSEAMERARDLARRPAAGFIPKSARNGDAFAELLRRE